MGIVDTVKKFRDNITGNKEYSNPEKPVNIDDTTNDKQLLSLLRQRRKQKEEMMKEQLKREIGSHEKERTKRLMYGTESKQGKKEGFVLSGEKATP